MDEYDKEIINKMIINYPNDKSMVVCSQPKRRFVVSYSVPGALNKNCSNYGMFLMTDVDANKRADQVVKEIKKKLPRELMKFNFLLKYKNILYEDATIAEIGIENDSTVELECLNQEKNVVRNEGIVFIYWSILPLIFGTSLILSGITGSFSTFFRSLYFLLGSIIAIPGLVYTFIGIAEYSPNLCMTSFVGKYWFSSSCCTCYNKNKHNDEDYTTIEDGSCSIQIVIPSLI